MECRIFESKFYNRKCPYDSLKESQIDMICISCLLGQILGQLKKKTIYDKLIEIHKEMITIK